MLAGCLSSDESSTDNGTNESPADSDSPGQSTLDLTEANVVDVSVEQGTEYSVAVSLHHDDEGEDGYANWWQVERLDGTKLGRRELLHPHDQQPFTRSATIDIPESVSCVVVRGHDQSHGYGGQAAVVALSTGETTFVEQGPTRESFTDEDCPS
jgi:hypothetical protein